MCLGMSDTKTKLINLVSDIENKDAVEYFYTFIALKLYGKSCCPTGHFTEICEMWEQHIKPRQEKQEQKKTEQTPEEKQIYECRTNITRKLWDIDRVDILKYIKIIVDDIYKEWEQQKERTEI